VYLTYIYKTNIIGSPYKTNWSTNEAKMVADTTTRNWKCKDVNYENHTDLKIFFSEKRFYQIKQNLADIVLGWSSFKRMSAIHQRWQLLLRIENYIFINFEGASVLLDLWSENNRWFFLVHVVNLITCGCESSAPFFVIYKAGREPTPYWW
jgi:hypothetical protein